MAKAPWWGGIFERMVKSTKRCLIKVIGKQRLNYEELNTVLIEIEAVVNNRPLTYIDEHDFDQILTPSHLFCGRRLLDKPVENHALRFVTTREEAVLCIKKIDTIIEHFWKRWQKEYLVQLRENQKMKTKKKKLSIEIGDVVLIQEEGVKRNKWPMGIIRDLIFGNDGEVRGALLQKTGGDGTLQTINRPIQKLYPLEIDMPHPRETTTERSTALAEDTEENDKANDIANNKHILSHLQTKSKRRAGREGERRRRLDVIFE